MSLEAGSDGTRVTPTLVFSLFSPLSLARGISLLSRPDVIIADQTTCSFWARSAGDGLHVRLNQYEACHVKTASEKYKEHVITDLLLVRRVVVFIDVFIF